MTEILSFLTQNWLDFFIPLAVFFLVLLSGYITQKILFSRLIRLAKKNNVKPTDWVVSAFRLTYGVFLFTLALYLCLRFSPLSANIVDFVLRALTILATMFVTLLLANLASWLFHRYVNRPGSKLPVNSIMGNIVRIIIITAGILVILGQLEIEITPMLATLGVGGLAIALALQPTLSNFFAGTQVVSDRAVKKGDFIELDGGVRGYVIDIGWRSTRLLTPYNTLVVLPNSRLAETVITNYNGTDNKLGFILYYGVSYDSDLQKVEKVAMDVGREVINELDEADKSFAPWFGFDEFGDSNITFWLWVQANDRLASFKMKSELIKRLHIRFAQEGIVHNYPVRLLI
jgi:small-conductance mechanosensitive channel